MIMKLMTMIMKLKMKTEMNMGDADEDEKDIDPLYRMFLENLTENGRSYKLTIYQKVEEPDYLEYEYGGTIRWVDNGNKATYSKDQSVKCKLAKTKGDTSITEEVPRKKKKINEPKSITEPNNDIVVERGYQLFLKNYSSNQLDYNGQMVNYETDGALKYLGPKALALLALPFSHH
ncbi:hypothetical protein Tco_1427947 [Tanacetum coccineum]